MVDKLLVYKQILDILKPGETVIKVCENGVLRTSVFSGTLRYDQLAVIQRWSAYTV